MHLRYNSPNPHDYVLKREWDSLVITGASHIGDLEKVIIGYVISSSVSRNGTKFDRSASYTQLQELIFEYLKINDPNQIKTFISINKTKLEELDTSRWLINYINEVIEMINYFERFEKRNIGQIVYSEFEPEGFSTLIAGSGTTPFRAYCNKKIKELIDMEILSKNELGRTHVTINPKTKFRWPKKTKK